MANREAENKHEKVEVKTEEVERGASSNAFLGLCIELDAAKAFTGIPASRTQPLPPEAEPPPSAIQEMEQLKALAGGDHPWAVRKKHTGQKQRLDGVGAEAFAARIQKRQRHEYPLGGSRASAGHAQDGLLQRRSGQL